MSENIIPQISANDVQRSIVEKRNFILLDVRTPNEFNNEKILGSINIPVDNIIDQIALVVPNKNEIIYVYCLSGSRSNIATNFMRQLGYTNVFSMTNGLLMWRSKKYSLIKKA